MNDNGHRAPRERDDVQGGAPATANVGVLEYRIDRERIARRAYQIYESRHRADGHADEDWLQATLEYAAGRASEATVPERYGLSSSFGDRIRDARR
jgi:hypothetical protein